MAIITISRDSFSRGTEVAEKIAKRLGYECIGHETVLEASGQSDISAMKLIQVLQDAPSTLDRVTYATHTKGKYNAYFQAALARFMQKDNVVYHGIAGHLVLKGISHVLKVRIIANIEDRIKHKMSREKVSYRRASSSIKKDDEKERKWNKYLYGTDARDPGLYDMVLPIDKIPVDNAIDIICYTVGHSAFKTTDISKKAMDSLVLAYEVKLRLIDLSPDIDVQASDGIVYVDVVAPVSSIEDITTVSRESEMIDIIKRITSDIPGIRDINVKVHYSVITRE